MATIEILAVLGANPAYVTVGVAEFDPADEPEVLVAEASSPGTVTACDVSPVV